MEQITVAQKNKMALQYGLLLGLIYIAITTAVTIFLPKMILFYSLKFAGYLIYLVLVGVFASMIRKANGGYMEFREVFGAIFIMLLVAGLMSFIYNYIYILYIDTHYMDKVRQSTITFMEKFNTPPDKVDEALKKFDEQVAESKTFHLGKNLMAYCVGLLMDCLFGLIVCAAVKRKRPEFGV